MIALVEVSGAIRDALRASGSEVVEYAAGPAFDADVADRRAEIEAVVVGAHVTDPIQAASRAYRLDPLLSVVIFGEDRAQCDRIRSALRFAPMIGNDVDCSHDTTGESVATIAAAAARTRSRRRHRKTVAAMGAAVGLAPRYEPHHVRERLAGHMIDLAPVGIVATTEDGAITTANVEATRILGITERALLGLPLGGDVAGADGGAWSRLLASAKDGSSAPLRFARHASTPSRWIEARAVFVNGDGGPGHLVIFADVTDRVMADAEMQVALTRAEAASRLKDEFIAVVSHELRTPLTAIIGWTRMLSMQRVAPDRVAHALQTIERNANAQATLIGDLLDLSRIEMGKMRLDLASTDVADVVTDAIDALAPAITAKQISVKRELAGKGAARLVADPDRLRQIVWNLLGNAVKFSPPGAVIRIALLRVESSVVLTVADTGMGISPDALPFIFDAFRQADGGRSRTHGGLGLGLAIVRRLVELHGGVVTARSEGLGRGSIFSITLPVAPVEAPPGDVVDPPPSEQPRHADPSESPSLRGDSILIVVDDEDSGALLSDLFVAAGATVRAARSVADAKDLLGSIRPSLVVSDLGFSEETGIALAEHIRAHHGATPTLALTEYARDADRMRALKSGFDAHATKPIDPVAMIALASQLIRRGKPPGAP